MYTVSSEYIKMNDIHEISNEVNEIKIRDDAQLFKYLSIRLQHPNCLKIV